MNCYAERAFYYWRHGLYGHVIKICEIGTEGKTANMFLNLYMSLARGILGDTEQALNDLKKLRGRSDLILVQKVALYLILSSAKTPDTNLCQQALDSISDKIATSNPVAIYYAAQIAWMFQKHSLAERILENVEETSLINTLKGWMVLTAGHPRRALEIFRKVLEDYTKSFDVMTLYGTAMCYSSLGETSECVQTMARILSRNDFPELNIEKARIYISSDKWDLAKTITEDVRPSLFSSLEVNGIAAIAALLKYENNQAAAVLLECFVEDCMNIERANWRYLIRMAFVLGSLCHQNLPMFNRTIKLATAGREGSMGSPEAAAVLGYHQFLAHNYVASMNTLQDAATEEKPNVLAMEFQVKLLIETGRLLEAQDILDMLYAAGYNSFVVGTLQSKLTRMQLNSNEAMIKPLLSSLSEHLKSFTTQIPFTRDYFVMEMRYERFQEVIMNARFDVIIDALDELITYNRSTSRAPTGETGQELSRILKTLGVIAPRFTPFLFYKALLFKKNDKPEDALSLFHNILLSNGVFRLPHALFASAEILFEKGDNEFALNCLDEAANEEPALVSTVDFAILKAKITNDVKNWLPLIVPLFESDKPSFLTYMKFIDLCIENEKYETAAAFLRKAANVVTHPSEKAMIVVRQSLIFAARKNYDRAFANLATLKKHSKYTDIVYSTEANICLNFMKDTTQYIEKLREYTEVDPCQKSFHLLGRGYDKLNDFNAAIEAYEKALEINNSDEQIVKDCIRACVHAHRFDDAVSKFTIGVGLLRNNGYGPISLIHLMIHLQRNSEAEQCISKVMRILSVQNKQLQADYLTLQGTVLANQKRYAEAEKSFMSAYTIMNEILQTENHNAFVTAYQQRTSKLLEKIGDNYLKLEKRDKALDFYHKSISLDEKNVSAVISTVNLHKGRYDTEKCMKICLDYLALDPCNEAVVLLLTSVETAKVRDLIPHLERVLQYHPRHYRALVRLVELCARSGRLKHAMQYVVNAECDDPGYHFVRGLYASYTGVSEKSLKWFKKAMLSTRWEVPAKIAMIGMIINPERKYTWLETTSLASPENIRRADEMWRSLRIDKTSKLLVKADILCSLNTTESLAKAEEIYSGILSEFPLHAGASVGLARIHTRNNKYDKAQSLLTTVFTGKPFHETFSYFEEAYLMKAHIVKQDTNSSIAQQYIFLALDMNMCCKKGWEMSAEIHKNKKMYNEASVAFGRCWDLCNHSDPEIGYNYAYCTMKAKRYETALSVCREMMNLYPEYKDLRDKVLVPSFKKMIV